MNAQVAERLSLENGLRKALNKNEFFLVYQPQMDIATEMITGFEALLRWQHPAFVPPRQIHTNCRKQRTDRADW
jgi:EAL domain-containing protein (putative c-di-GMP-specific phosphodiesterase class I)